MERQRDEINVTTGRKRKGKKFAEKVNLTCNDRQC